jgi:hypothetical protein
MRFLLAAVALALGSGAGSTGGDPQKSKKSDRIDGLMGKENRVT